MTREERKKALLKLNQKRTAEGRAMQLFAQTIDDDSLAMEIAELYPKWDELIGKTAKTGFKFQFGTNAFGDPQLYVVIGAEHQFAEYWPPSTQSMYKKWGVSNGYPIWTQPLGSTDAYDLNDIVSHKDELWISTHPGKNTWEPGVYGWEKYKQ